MPTPDVIIVGAGSAGCVLAHQLRQNAGPGLSITLIEPPSTPAPQADQTRPSRWLNLLGSSEDWDFATEKTAGLAGRPLRWPRGRGLGGSSRINAMIWFPPTESDFQNLAKSSGTTLAAAKRAFQLAESLVAPEIPKWSSHAATAFFVAAADLAGKEMMYRRMNRDGRRWNPVELLAGELLAGDDNRVVRASVDRLVFDGDCATGVVTASGETIRSGRVVLCAGTMATPAILMRSGIGPRDVLSDCGIDVRHEAPEVGSDLQDHLIMPVIFGVKPEHEFKTSPSQADIEIWQTVGGGPIASNIAEAGGLFLNGTIQAHVTPTHYLTFPQPGSAPAMTIGVNVTQPESHGRLRIVSADPNAPPQTQPAYLDREYDLHQTIKGVRWAREFATTTSLSEMITGELLPSKKRESDEAIAKSITRFAQTLYHPVGTASGVALPENIWIADASALSRITVGNPTASVMTLALCVAEEIQSAI